MRYKNIIFDVGGVLLSYRWLGLIMESIPDEQEARKFAAFMFDDPLWLQFDLEIRPFDDVVADYIKKKPEYEKHIRYMMTHLEGMPLPRPRVWEKVHRLKEAGYRIYILSNYSSRMFNVHTAGMPFHDDLDGGVISYQVHTLKPHREIYEALLSRYSLDPSECLFFDDRQDNIEGALKCGIDGRVIYSEETLLGYLDRLLAKDGISCPFHDPALSRSERIEWLVSHMTDEEKISYYARPERGVARYGVEGFVPGGEAAHGVEARNDQNGLTYPDITTSFPEPIGMSASWDPELLREAGRIVGQEARASFRLHRKTGLSRWAPTVDMSRDPRWGRNEEGYGEDPCLASVNSTAYIRGMQGTGSEGWEKGHVLCGSTLKHFFANNTEKDRYYGNSSMDARDKYDYYLPPFISALKEGHALGVMTAYNRINGIPGMLDPEVGELKEKYGMVHAVSDGYGMTRLRDYHHDYGTSAEVLAASLDAGVDWLFDRSERVESALRDALDLGILDRARLDDAIGRILMLGMMLGVYDQGPYDHAGDAGTDTEEARDICRRLSEESLVLLENKSLLPLSKDDAKGIALIGPLADTWRADWYAGKAPFRHTVRDGIRELTGVDPVPFMGLDIYRIVTGDRAWHVREDGAVVLVPEEEGDSFHIEDRGDGAYVFIHTETGKYVQSTFFGLENDDRGYLRADRDDVYDWFVTCRFHLEDTGSGIRITNRFNKPVGLEPGGTLRGEDGQEEMLFTFRKLQDGPEAALAYAKDCDTVILALGCDPMMPAREDFDRKSLTLPKPQQRLLDAFVKSGKKTVAVLITNYPYTLGGAEKKLDALLVSATGSQYMGDAIASAIFGDFSPAGCLVQGWPASDEMLPPMTDYGIRGKRTCRYVDEGMMYPFGYGISYTEFEYSDLKAKIFGQSESEASGSETSMSAASMSAASESAASVSAGVNAAGAGVAEISLSVKNTGDRTSDHVVQIYATLKSDDPMFERYGYGRRLVAFRRMKDMKPGEERRISLTVDRTRLSVYDPAARDYILPGGIYTFHTAAGAASAACSALSVSVKVEGEDFAMRDLSRRIPVYYCDESEGVEFTKGHFGMRAARIPDSAVAGDADKAGAVAAVAGKAGPSLTYYRCSMPKNAQSVKILLRSKEKGEVKVLWNGKPLASWSGSTSSYNEPVNIYRKPAEDMELPEKWDPVWCEIECSLGGGDGRMPIPGVWGTSLSPGPDFRGEKTSGDEGSPVETGRIDIIPGGDAEVLSFFIYNGI